jgi:hypothetical protein
MGGHAHGDPGEVDHWELANWGKAAGSIAQVAHALVQASHHGAPRTIHAFTRTEASFGEGRWR